ncbi:MAG: ATP-binding protein [Tessaracoccus sp.]
MTSDAHLSVDDMPLFTRLRMTAFGEAVIDIANDPAYDQWTFSAKIRHALDHETAARTERRVLVAEGLRHPNPAACIEDIHYLAGRNLSRDLIARLGACRWIDQTHNLVILGKSSVGKSSLAQALVNAACRRDYTARYFRLDDLANRLAVYQREDAARLTFLNALHSCDVLVLDDFLTTPITGEIAAELLNILAAREHRGYDSGDQPIRPRGLVPLPARRRYRRIDPEPHRLHRRARPTRRPQHASPHPHPHPHPRHDIARARGPATRSPRPHYQTRAHPLPNGPAKQAGRYGSRWVTHAPILSGVVRSPFESCAQSASVQSACPFSLGWNQSPSNVASVREHEH